MLALAPQVEPASFISKWCLRMLLGIKWYQFVRNDDVRRLTHCYNPVAPAYPVWAYYAHGPQRRCQDDPVSLPSGRLEKTTRSSPHHVAQQRPTGSETTPPHAPRSSRFGSEPPSVEDDVDVWRYAIVRVVCQKRRRPWVYSLPPGFTHYPLGTCIVP